MGKTETMTPDSPPFPLALKGRCTTKGIRAKRKKNIYIKNHRPTPEVCSVMTHSHSNLLRNSLAHSHSHSHSDSDSRSHPHSHSDSHSHSRSPPQSHSLSGSITLTLSLTHSNCHSTRPLSLTHSLWWTMPPCTPLAFKKITH